MSERLIELFLFDIFIAITKIEQTVSNFENSDDLKHHYLSCRELISFKIKTINPELKQEILDAMIEENSYLSFVVKELELLTVKK